MAWKKRRKTKTQVAQNPESIEPQGFQGCIFFGNKRQVGASFVSLAPIFFCKSQSTLTPLLLLSKSNPLRWASIWFWVQAWKLLASILLRYSKNRQAPLAACRFWFIHASVYPKSNEISRATILPQGIASWSEWLPASILRTPHRDQALVRNESTGDYIQSQRAYSSNPDRILPFISSLFHGTKYALQTQCILSENGGID